MAPYSQTIYLSTASLPMIAINTDLQPYKNIPA